MMSVRAGVKKIGNHRRAAEYVLKKWRSTVMVTSACTMFSIAAYSFDNIAGHVAVGVSLLALNFLSGEESR